MRNINPKYPFLSNLYFVAFLSFLLLFCDHACATLRMTINRGNAEKYVISFVVAKSSNSDEHYSEELLSIVGDDLVRSGIFKIVDPPRSLLVDSSANPKSPDWKSSFIGNRSSFFLAISCVSNPSGKIDLKVRMMDVATGRQVVGNSISTDVSGFRRAAHIIADQVYSALTGEEGYFDTRIVYVADLDNRVKKIAIMDQDGFNGKYLTDGSSLVMTPRFSPESQRIVYMFYNDLNARVCIKNLETGSEEVIGNFTGVNSAPRFSPKGNSVLMARSINGSTDLYEVNLSDRSRKRLTVRSAINTSPSFSPDQSKIVFTSDRSGKANLYVMNADGSGQHRISFGTGSYSSPVWSPRGDWIAFSKFTGKDFYIGVMRPDGSGERLLNKSYLVESPTWSPNGRVIIFTKEDKLSKDKKVSRLYSIDLTGDNGLYLPTPTAASDPAWSPLLSKSML